MQEQENPNDVQQQTEEGPITIIPAFNQQVIELVAGRYGPFKVNKPIVVPLWLAIYLKQRKECSIQLPHVYNEKYLEDKIKEEKDEKNALQSFPFDFFELFQILFEKLCYKGLGRLRQPDQSQEPRRGAEVHSLFQNKRKAENN